MMLIVKERREEERGHRRDFTSNRKIFRDLNKIVGSFSSDHAKTSSSLTKFQEDRMTYERSRWKL
ncbi:hypothetical protein V1477_018454 [Vespula maculifrons]|uniref:Uncharacterized protein n=1 Tax=Vespula maculifrons TaxID=7453 RepID=A0ABD2AVF6_VESMC